MAAANDIIEVDCGGKTGLFDLGTYRVKGAREPCIECEGVLYTPRNFEVYCGKDKAKRWKTSIRYQGRPLIEYLQSIGLENSSKATENVDNDIVRKRANSLISSPPKNAKKGRPIRANISSSSTRGEGEDESSEGGSVNAMEELEEEVSLMVEEDTPQSLARGDQDTKLGTIKKLLLINFMCHSRFEVEFCPNVNFIHGSNGSGKSAIVNGIIVALGGRAKATDRASSVKGFIQHGCNFAEVTIWLCNEVSALAHHEIAYKYDAYGDTIQVTRRITSDGQSTYQVKNSNGRTLSTKKEELVNIVECFNIQVNNPISVLSQDMSREYFHQQDHKKSIAKYYEIFARATLFEDAEKNLEKIAELNGRCKKLLERKDAECTGLVKPIREMEKRIELAESCDGEENRLEKLRLELKWACLGEIKARIQRQKLELEAECDKRSRLVQRVDACQGQISKAESEKQKLFVSIGSLRESIEEMEEQKLSVLNERRSKEKKHREIIMSLKSQKKGKDEVRGSIAEFKRKIADIRRRQRLRDETNSVQVRNNCERRLEELKVRSEEVQSLLIRNREEKKETENANDVTTKELREVRYKCEDEESTMQNIQRDIRTMESARENRLRVFGPWVPQLLQEMERNRSRFRRMPKGPLGSLMSVKEQKWAPVIERSFRKDFFPAFLCDNHRDSEVLKSIMRRVIDSHRHPVPDVYTAPFRDSVYRYQDTTPTSPYPTMLSVIDVRDPDVLNLILDLHQPHKVLLIEDPHSAREYIFFNCPPKASKAYALDACEVFPNGSFYHGFNNLRSLYFPPNREDNIRSLREDAIQTEKALMSLQRRRDKLERDNRDQRDQCRKLTTTISDLLRKQRAISSESESLERRLASIIEDDAEEFEEEIALNEEEIVHLQEEMEEIDKKMEEAQESLEEVESDIDQIVENLNVLCQQLTELKERKTDEGEDVGALNGKINRMTSKKMGLQKRVDTLDQNVASLEDGLKKQKELFQGTRDEVLRVNNGVEITTSRSPEDIEREIRATQDVVEKERENLPNVTELKKKYTERTRWYKQLQQQISKSKDFTKLLHQSAKSRRSKLVVLKDVIGFRVSQVFKKELEARGFTGKLRVDNVDRVIEMMVRISHSSQGSTNTRSLSGGERSYTTICFLKALWSVAQCPFRILDEFDVFMDVMSRDVAIRRLLDVAETDAHHQYLLLTPQSTINDLRVRNPERTKILYLSPPERTEDGMMEEE